MSRLLASLALVGLASLALSQAPNVAAVRFGQFARQGELRLLLGTQELTAQPFGSLSGYLNVPAGATTLELWALVPEPTSEAAPETAPVEATPLARLPVELEAGVFYTFLAYPTPDEAGATSRLLSLRDDLPAPRAGAASLRLVNLDAAGLFLETRLSDPPDPESEDAERGRLRIVLEPAESSVVILGPDGYLATFEGATTLADLAPGRYIVNAAYSGYESAAAETVVSAGSRSDLSLRLEPLPDAPPALPDEPLASAPALGGSPYASLAAGRYDLTLSSASAAIADLAGVDLEPGLTYSLFVYRGETGDLMAVISLDALVVQQPLEAVLSPPRFSEPVPTEP